MRRARGRERGGERGGDGERGEREREREGERGRGRDNKVSEYDTSRQYGIHKIRTELSCLLLVETEGSVQ